ncbi:MAG: hypothetical protein ACXVLZ_00700 [Acidimicrobiia bacterium]
MRVRFILLVGIAVLTAGCAWPMAGQGPSRRAWAEHDTTVTPANVGSLTAGPVGPVASASAEVVGDQDGLFARTGSTVKAFDGATGGSRWSAGGLPGVGTPGLYSGRVFVPVSAARCSVVKLDRDTGAVADSAVLGPVPGPSWTSSCTTGDIVVDGDTIIVPWRQTMSTVVGCGTNTTVASGLTAYDFGFEPVWFDSSSVTACGVPPVPAHNLPRVSRIGDRIVAAATGETANVYDPATCVDFSVCHPVAHAVTTDGVWVGSATTWTSRNGAQLWSVDGSSGALVWRSPTDSARTVTADPAFDADHAFAPSGASGSANLGVYAAGGCGQATCAPSWTVPLPAVASFRPSIAGDVVVVATADKHFVLASRTGCSKTSCAALRTLTLAGTPTGPASIAAGRILVPTTSGIETFALPA